MVKTKDKADILETVENRIHEKPSLEAVRGVKREGMGMGKHQKGLLASGWESYTEYYSDQ